MTRPARRAPQTFQSLYDETREVDLRNELRSRGSQFAKLPLQLSLDAIEEFGVDSSPNVSSAHHDVYQSPEI